MKPVTITAVSTVWIAETEEMAPTLRMSRKRRHCSAQSSRAGRSGLRQMYVAMPALAQAKATM